MGNKDWTGNTQAVMATLNASSHALGEREQHDYYATPPKAVEQLLSRETFSGRILEPACGEGHISKVLVARGFNVESTDLIYRGYPALEKAEGKSKYLSNGTGVDHWCDFLARTELFNGSIITNPPFSMSQEFLEKSISLIPEGEKVAMLLRVQFLEGVKRYEMFQRIPPKKMYVFSRNIRCAKNGDFENATGNASTYCWFVWEKGFKGSSTIDWII